MKLKEIKYCIECKWYKAGKGPKLGNYDHYCLHSRNKGKDRVWCLNMRGKGNPCGPEGKFWEEREVKDEV